MLPTSSQSIKDTKQITFDENICFEVLPVEIWSGKSSRQRLKLAGPECLVDLCVNNNKMYIAYYGKYIVYKKVKSKEIKEEKREWRIVRIDMDRADLVQEIDLPFVGSSKEDCVLSLKLFQDFSGNNLIVKIKEKSTKNQSINVAYYYINSSTSRATLINSLSQGGDTISGRNGKIMDITAIAWLPFQHKNIETDLDISNEKQVGPCVFGTSDGHIYKMTLKLTPSLSYKDSYSIECPLKHLYQIQKELETSEIVKVCSIYLDYQSLRNVSGLFAIVSTASRIYYFGMDEEESNANSRMLAVNDINQDIEDLFTSKLPHSHNVPHNYSAEHVPESLGFLDVYHTTDYSFDLESIVQKNEKNDFGNFISSLSGLSSSKFITSASRTTGFPSHAVWCCAVGMYRGDMTLNGHKKGILGKIESLGQSDENSNEKNPAFLSGTKVSHFPRLSHLSNQSLILPDELRLSRYHAIMTFSGRYVYAVNLMKNRIVWDCDLGDKQALNNPFDESLREDDSREQVYLKLAYDSTRETYWLYKIPRILRRGESSNYQGFSKIHELVINQNIPRKYPENMKLTRQLLENQQYRLSLYISRKNYTDFDETLAAIGYKLFGQGYYDDAADVWSFSKSIRIEQVGLEFMKQIGKNPEKCIFEKPLRRYLLKKSKHVGIEKKSQMYLIYSWILQLYLSEIKKYELKDSNDEHVAQIFNEMTDWIESNMSITFLDKRVTYQLFESHNCPKGLLCFARAIEDFDKMIELSILSGGYSNALQLLSQSSSGHASDKVRESDPELVYKYSSQLINLYPEELVSLWKSNPSLDPKRLIPAILAYSDNYENFRSSFTMKEPIIDYLEYCIETGQNTDPSIHNYILYLYTNRKNKNGDYFIDNAKLLGFLKSKPRHYDLRYALSLCETNQNVHAVAVIYEELGMLEKSVDYCLQYSDIDLATIFAMKPIFDEALSKQLWLKIARFILEVKNDPKQALFLIEKSQNIISIQDILPFLPENTSINDFKRELSESLEKYQHRMDMLTNEMESASLEADLLKKELEKVENESMIMPDNAKCQLCNKELGLMKHYIFRCFHAFCVNCIMQYSLENLMPKRTKDHILSLLQEIESAHDSHIDLLISHNEVSQQFDDILGAECPFCGETAAKSIDKPFYDRNDVNIIEQWNV